MGPAELPVKHLNRQDPPALPSPRASARSLLRGTGHALSVDFLFPTAQILNEIRIRLKESRQEAHGIADASCDSHFLSFHLHLGVKGPCSYAEVIILPTATQGKEEVSPSSVKGGGQMSLTPLSSLELSPPPVPPTQSFSVLFWFCGSPSAMVYQQVDKISLWSLLASLTLMYAVDVQKNVL